MTVLAKTFFTFVGSHFMPFSVLDRVMFNDEPHWMIAVLSAFSETPSIDFLHTDLSSLTLYNQNDIPNLSGWQKIDCISVPHGMKKRFFGNNKFFISENLDFLQDHSDIYLSLYSLRQLAPILSYCKRNKDEAFSKLETYGLYAYPTNDGSRLALILDRFLSPYGTECVLVALLRKHTFCTDYMTYIVSHIGIYSADTLPNTEEWTLVNRLIPADYVPDNMKVYLAKYGTVKDECIQRFFANGSLQTIQGMLCTLGNFLRTDFSKL